MSGFHEAFATVVACQQGQITPPDTWFRPIYGGGGCICSDCWNHFSRLYTDLITMLNLTFTELRGFHVWFATGVACKQGALTLPDTWLRPPFWDLLGLQLLRPDSPNLSFLYSTFILNTPRCFLNFAFYHYPCTTAGGQFVPEGTCRVVIVYEWQRK